MSATTSSEHTHPLITDANLCYDLETLPIGASLN
jgi:hypothetical protein